MTLLLFLLHKLGLFLLIFSGLYISIGLLANVAKLEVPAAAKDTLLVLIFLFAIGGTLL